MEVPFKIQCIRFCSWKGRRLNRTLAWTIGVVVITEKQRLTVSSLHSFNVQRVSFTHHGLILSFTDGRTDWLTDPNNEINVVVLLLTGRPTEIPEKDIYLNEARYDEEEGQFRKLKGLKVLWSLTEIYSWINYSWTNEWIGCSVENVRFYQKGGSRSKIVLVKQANKVVRLIQNWLS